MTSLKSKKIMVIDNGSFFSTAIALTDYYKEVLYFTQWTSGFPGMDKYVLGTEWKNGQKLEQYDSKPLKRIDSIWNNLKEVDIILICDVYDGDIADFLTELGYPVVHAGYKGAELELNRWEFKKVAKAQGMDMNNATRIVGIDNLRNHLEKVKDKFIKISRFRKLTETFHHETYTLSLPLLQKMENELGPMAKIMEFIVEDPIDCICEEGFDSYTINGVYPKIAFAGAEIKDKSYYGEILPYDKLSEGIKKTNAQLSSLLKKVGYKGFFSTEVRTTKNKHNYLIDMTCREPMPPSPLYGALFSNLGDIVWGLGNNEVIDIKPKEKCGLYLTISSDWYDEHHQAIYFPKEYTDNIKLSYPLKVDDVYYCLNINHFPECGSVITTGSSYEECFKQMQKIVPTIKGYGIKINIEDCIKAKEEFDKMQKQ